MGGWPRGPTGRHSRGRARALGAGAVYAFGACSSCRGHGLGQRSQPGEWVSVTLEGDQGTEGQLGNRGVTRNRSDGFECNTMRPSSGQRRIKGLRLDIWRPANPGPSRPKAIKRAGRFQLSGTGTGGGWETRDRFGLDSGPPPQTSWKGPRSWVRGWNKRKPRRPMGRGQKNRRTGGTGAI